MICKGKIQIGSTSAYQAGVYEFGLSNPNSQTIAVWSVSNVFTNLPAGVYKWQVRKKGTGEPVKIGYSTVLEKNNCSETVLNLDYGLYLHPIEVANGQTDIPLPALASKYKFVCLTVNNIDYENGAEYVVENGVIKWRSPFALEATDKIRIKYIYFSQI